VPDGRLLLAPRGCTWSVPWQSPPPPPRASTVHPCALRAMLLPSRALTRSRMPVGPASPPCSPRSTVDAVAAALVPATPSRVSAAALGSSRTDCNKVYPVPCSWCWCWLPPAALHANWHAAAPPPPRCRMEEFCRRAQARPLLPAAGRPLPGACVSQFSPFEMQYCVQLVVRGGHNRPVVHAAPAQVLCGRARPLWMLRVPTLYPSHCSGSARLAASPPCISVPIMVCKPFRPLRSAVWRFHA
jgi:hypothetical protein